MRQKTHFAVGLDLLFLLVLSPHTCLTTYLCSHIIHSARKHCHNPENIKSKQQYIPIGCVLTAALTTTRWLWSGGGGGACVCLLSGRCTSGVNPFSLVFTPNLVYTPPLVHTPASGAHPCLWCTPPASGVHPLPLVYTPCLWCTPPASGIHLLHHTSPSPCIPFDHTTSQTPLTTPPFTHPFTPPFMHPFGLKVCWMKPQEVCTLLAFTAKYGVSTNQWTWLCQALLEVSMTTIALWICVCADDWAAELAVKASNDYKLH